MKLNTIEMKKQRFTNITCNPVNERGDRNKRFLSTKTYFNLTYTKTIFRENKGKSGIYRFVNLVNGRTYIGSSADLMCRFRDYLSVVWLNKELQRNQSIIYRALLKYGYENFRLEILEYCEKSECIKREQFYLDTLSPYYNICTKAGSSLGRVTTDTTRLKLRMARMALLYKTSKTRSRLLEFTIYTLSMRVDKLSLKTSSLRKKLDSIVNKTEFKWSDLTRYRLLQASLTARPVAVLYLNTGITTEYPSARNAALALNTTDSTIRNKLNGINTKPYKGRYIISKESSSSQVQD
nr:hypothetical protein [Valsa mali var. pyri (nom. inval.)]